MGASTSSPATIVSTDGRNGNVSQPDKGAVPDDDVNLQQVEVARTDSHVLPVVGDKGGASSEHSLPTLPESPALIVATADSTTIDVTEQELASPTGDSSLLPSPKPWWYLVGAGAVIGVSALGFVALFRRGKRAFYLAMEEESMPKGKTADELQAEGARLATRALGIATAIVSVVGVTGCTAVYKLSGAESLDDFGIMLKRKGRQIGKDLFGRDPTDEAQVDKEIEDAANAVLSSALSAQAQTDTMTEPTGTSNDG
eukprot:m.116310 g.116310  ORF g.116310 m.116310 type:complete len:256 (-) comp13603_c0_seq2:208-975(-)